MKLTIISIILFVVSGNTQQRIKLLNEVPYEDIEIRFSHDTIDKYVFIERVANISDGEIYWIKEEIDTITIKCLENNESYVVYEINESANDWMGMLYAEDVYELINEEISFPKIKYLKYKSSKEGIFPDSCQLSQFTKNQLNNSIRLLKEVGKFSYVNSYERIIENIGDCNASKFNYLKQSRNLIALENYIIPINKDTLKYEITQLEHFGLRTKIAAFKSKSHEGNDIINLTQYDYQEETKQDWNKIIEMNKDNLNDEEKMQYEKIRDSNIEYNKATIELDENSNLIRYLNKTNRHYIDKSNKKQFRFYNYEIKKIAYR